MVFGGKSSGFFGGNAEKENQEVKEWIKQVVLEVEKKSDILGIYSCNIQIINGNCVEIFIQDWYDEMISRFGKEHGLDKFFCLTPAEGSSDIYIN